MLKIFRYLKNSKAMVFAIILLLVVQAGCDLSLPEYTSNIVDVGIQQGGIERVTPEKIRKETYDSLKLFMTDAEIARVEPYYTENQEGICERNTESTKSSMGWMMLLVCRCLFYLPWKNPVRQI